jgi:hypothetical protein
VLAVLAVLVAAPFEDADEPVLEEPPPQPASTALAARTASAALSAVRARHGGSMARDYAGHDEQKSTDRARCL